MKEDSAWNYVGIGPMRLGVEQMVANQGAVIRNIREQVSAASHVLTRDERDDSIDLENFEPHHVITIVGGRGVGKTSVLMTAMHQIREEMTDALVLDIIHPDQMASERIPLAPTIVSYIERSIEKLMHERHQALQDSKHLKWHHLGWALRFDETFQLLARDSINTAEWNERLYRLLSQTIDPASAFQEWLDNVLERVDKRILVLAIDDADIAIDRAEEIIDTLRTYLAHRRIITIVAVDIPSLERRIRNKRLSTLPMVPEFKEAKEGQIPSLFLGLSPDAFRSAEADAEQEYVDNLLTKALPQASRCYLAGLSDWERLNRKIRIPGQQQYVTLLDLIRVADATSRVGSGADLSPILERHPELLSGNLRRYTNQLLMIRDACNRFRRGELSNRRPTVPTSSVEGESQPSSEGAYGDSMVTQEQIAGHTLLRPIDSPAQEAKSRFHMDIVGAFLSSGEFSPVIDHINRNLGVDLERLGTMHDLVRFFLRWGTVEGTKSWKLRYEIAGRPLRSAPTSELVDLCVDWALANGGTMEEVIRELDLHQNSPQFQPIPMPRRLEQSIAMSGVTDLEPNSQILETSLFNFVGPAIVVPGGEDHLAPTFVRDSNALGRFTHRISNGRQPIMTVAIKHANEIDQTDEADLTQERIREAYYRVLGFQSFQCLAHLDIVANEVVRHGDILQLRLHSPLRFEANTSVPWVLVEIRGLLGTLRSIVETKESEDHVKLSALSYVADLPLRSLLRVASDPDAERDRVAILSGVQVLFDRLMRGGLLSGRRLKSLSAGRLARKVPPSVQRWRDEMSDLYPSVNWDRRLTALDEFLAFVSELKIGDQWDRRTQPPPAWVRQADAVLSNSTPKRRKRRAPETALKTTRRKADGTRSRK